MRKKERITVVVNNTTQTTKEMTDSSVDTSGEWTTISEREDGQHHPRSKSMTRAHGHFRNTASTSQRRSKSTTTHSRERSNRTNNTHQQMRSPNTEPDLVISVGNRDFHYFSPVIAYMSDYLSQQMVQIEEEKLRIDFSHKSSKEWEKYIYPFLEKHSGAEPSNKTSSFPTVNRANIAIVLPWFQEFGLQDLLQDCDDLLATLFFVSPFKADRSDDDRQSVVSGQEVRDAVSLLNIAFSCSLPQTQARAADLVQLYLHHSPKTWLLLDDEQQDGSDDDEDGNVSIFVRLAQVLQEYPMCREVLFARYNPNILEMYLPPELIPYDKESQSDWFWEELVTNPLFPFLLRERVRRVVHQMEKSKLEKLQREKALLKKYQMMEKSPSSQSAKETPVETKPTPKEQPPAPAPPPTTSSFLYWPVSISWFPSFTRTAPPPVSPTPTNDEEEDEEEDDDESEEEDDEDFEDDEEESMVNERSQLIHDVLDKIREPQHNFLRRSRTSNSTALVIAASRRILRSNSSLPQVPPMPVLHESRRAANDDGGDTTDESRTPERLHRPSTTTTSSPMNSGSPRSTASTDIMSMSSGSATLTASLSSRRTFAC